MSPPSATTSSTIGSEHMPNVYVHAGGSQKLDDVEIMRARAPLRGHDLTREGLNLGNWRVVRPDALGRHRVARKAVEP